MNAHILLIEPDEALARLIELELSYEAYCVTALHDNIRGLAAVWELQPDLIILDSASPGLPTLEVCYRLRIRGSTASIILLNDSQTEDACVKGFNAGADDCMFKPFNFEEFLARVRARLRRMKLLGEADVLCFENLCLNQTTREVYRDQQEIQLTAKEFDLLKYFMLHPRQVLSREQITERIWGYESDVCSNVIEVYVGYLRRKLEINHQNRLIHTIRSVGYTLREDASTKRLFNQSKISSISMEQFHSTL